MTDGSLRTFGWGKGWAFTAAITFCVLILLSFNLVALGLSFPEVIDGAPRTYGSRLKGTIDLPYVPGSPDDLNISIQENVSVGMPFGFSIGFPGGKVPYGVPYLQLHAGRNEYTYRMGMPGNGSGHWLTLLVPGLPHPGRWNTSLILSRDLAPSTDDLKLELTSLEVTGSADGGPVLIPDLDEELMFGTNLTFTCHGEPLDDEMWLQIDGGEMERMVPIEGGYRAPSGPAGGGWHVGRIMDRENISNGYEFLFRVPDQPPFPYGLEVVFKRALLAEDELYEQENHPFQLNENVPRVKLFGSAYYNISFRDVQGSDDVNRVPNHLLPYGIRPAISLGYEGGHVPLTLDPDTGLYRGVAPIFTDKVEISLHLNRSGIFSDGPLMAIMADIMEDHSPDLEVLPDPFLDPYSGSDRELTIFTGREPVGDPAVHLGNVRLDLTAHDRSGGSEWKVWLPVENCQDGSELTIDVETEYSFFSYLLLIFPFPPFLLGVPPIFIGWPLVGWFALTSAIIVWASVSLFMKGLGQVRRDKRRPEDLTDFLSKWGMSETARVLSAMIFFSLAIYYLFELLEQPTPSPSILSRTVPVWIRMINLAEASVWEEFSGRLLLIGLPLAFIRGFRANVRYDEGKRFGGLFDARQLLGGTGRFGKAEIVLISLSALSFGFAHLGWGPWKVAPTLVSGLLFGYLFVKVGIHATIVIHFIIDYLMFLDELTGFGNVASSLVLLFLALGGCLLLGDHLFRALKLILSTFGRRQIPSYFFLILHSLLSAFLAISLVGIYGVRGWTVLIMCVPLMDVAGYLLHRFGKPDMGKGAVYIASLITMAIGPVGTAWIFSTKSDQERPE